MSRVVTVTDAVSGGRVRAACNYWSEFLRVVGCAEFGPHTLVFQIGRAALRVREDIPRLKELSGWDARPVVRHTRRGVIYEPAIEAITGTGPYSLTVTARPAEGG